MNALNAKSNTNYKTNKIINGETVSYTIVFAISFFILCAVKQILKTFFSVPVAASCICAFAAASIVSFLLEKRFVYGKGILASNLKQIIFFIIRAGVNLGFYKLAYFGFYDLLDMPISFVWFISAFTAFAFNYVYDRTLMFDCSYEPQSVSRSKIYKTFYRNRYVFLAGGFAAIILTAVYIVYSVFPFGDYTIMRMDLYHQYGPLFTELYDRVVNHESFLYSWTSGGGTSFLGDYFNYLSSPFTALIFLFDKEDISFAITFMVSVKCIFSAFTFSFYVRKSLGGQNLYAAAFGAFYAFSAYFAAYYWNVMWLDGMIMLPLIALGIEQIINKGDGRLYTASMVYLFFANYYMGFMSCIFAVLYFIAYFIISYRNGGKIDPSRRFEKKFSTKAMMNYTFVNRGLRFAFYSLIAAALCALSLVPVYMILKNSSATSDTFPSEFTSYFDILDFVTSHFAGLETTIRSSGDNVLPNIYSGILTVLLVPLFIMNNKISLREKAVYVLMLIFFLFSFDNNCANYIWHAMHFPNDLPFRFSYMYSFVLIIIGYKAAVKLKAIKPRDIAATGMCFIFAVIVCQKFMTNKMTNITIYMTIAFILLWVFYLMLIRRRKYDKRFAAYLLVILMVSELTINTAQGVQISQTNEDYKTNYNTYTEAIENIKSSDKGFYRTELCKLNTRMDPCYYGYDGMSIFSSMAYESYSELQHNLGMYGNRINSYTYNTQTPIYNMMFNIKYLIRTDESLEPSGSLYNKIYETGDEISTVYKNKYYLPIAYCVNSKIDDWITEEGNPFEIQSDFIKLATGYSGVFSDVEYLSTDFDGTYGDDVSQNGTYWINKDDSESTFGEEKITLSPTTNGNLYIYVKSSDVKTLTVNSDKVSNISQDIDTEYILDVGYHNKGDEVTITLDAGAMETESSSFDIYCCSVNEKALKNAYSSLESGAINVTKHSDTSITGTVTAKEDCCLYSSIPYDSGWKVYIDGKEAKTFEIGSAMLGVQLKAGTHTIEYKFSPSGFYCGAAITVVTALGICGYYIFNKSNKRKKNKNKKIVD